MKPQSYLLINQYLAGIVAGFTQVVIGQPFDILKVRLQTSTHFINIRHCFYNIYKNEGLSAFFKGTCAPLLGTGFLVSIQMGTNQLIKKFLRKENSELLNYKQIFLSGSLAGLLGSLISSPVEHGKIRMQMQIQQKKYGGSMHALLQIYDKHGLRGVYKGFIITQLRQTIPTGIYFLNYQIGKRNMRKYIKSDDLKWYHIFPIGAFAGLSYWFFSYPFDLVKTRIQHDSLEKPIYSGLKGILKAFLQMKQQGFQSHLNGFNICMLRAIPVYGINFIVFQKIIEYLTRVQNLNIKYL